MKKAIAVILLTLMIPATLLSDPIVYEYESYEEEEFPIWSLELRRAESIFFGSLVLTYPVAMGIYSLVEYCGGSVPSDQASRVLQQAAVAAGLSLIIAGTDWLIGRFAQ